MMTCPRCGAENKDNASVCRMCATPLDAAGGAPQRPAPSQHEMMPATVVMPAPGSPQQGAPGGKTACPSCQAMNDADWAFCQQCGTRLQGAAPQQQPPAGGPAPSWGAATVVTPSPQPPAQQPPGGGAPSWGAPTVVTPVPQMPPQQPPQQPQQPPAGGAPSWGAPTVVTPAPDFASYGNPPQQGGAGQQPPSWGAPTVVTPMPPQPPQSPQPQPPAGGAPSWGAPTVVTPAPDFASYGNPPNQGQQSYGNPPPNQGQQSYGNPPPAPPSDDQRYVETVVGPLEADINAYPATVVGPMEIPPTNEMPAAEPPPPPKSPTSPNLGSTQGIGNQQPSMADQRTVIMSSTPVATPPKAARLLLIMEGGEIGETYSLRPSETVIGRVDGDIKFPHDGYMSSRHARIIQRNGRFFLLDNNSRNGTFVRIHQEVELHPGDVVLVGKQLFRFETQE